MRTSQDLDLKLVKITLVKFTYPTQCPKVLPLSHCFLWVRPRPDECRWDFLTFAVTTSSSLYGCSNNLIGSEENLCVSLSCVALILRWTRHLTKGILTKYAEVLNFKTLDACCLLDSCKTKQKKLTLSSTEENKILRSWLAEIPWLNRPNLETFATPDKIT